MQFQFLQKKLWLQYRYQNSTLVSVPDTDIEFWLHTNCYDLVVARPQISLKETPEDFVPLR